MVSIIIPVWGEYKKYLDECVDSVKSQTYKDYEIIIVDDCFDLPTARNNGIIKARGEWILALDVDNKILPDFLEKTVGKGDIVTTYQQHFEGEHGIFCPHKPILADFFSGNKIDANTLFKKEVWEKVGGYDENMKEGWEDYDFWVRCMIAGYEIEVVEEPLLLYRKHGETMASIAGRNSTYLQKYIFDKHNLKI